MEVILLKKLANLGELGDTVRVKSGYARNYLIPQGKAVFATKENLAQFEQRRAEFLRLADEELALAEQRREKLEGLTLTIPVKMATEDKIFGSVGSTEISIAIKTACGEEVERKEIDLPDRAFRDLGTFEVKLILHTDVSVMVSLNIVPE